MKVSALITIVNLMKCKKGLAEWFSGKFTLYKQSFDYSTP